MNDYKKYKEMILRQTFSLMTVLFSLTVLPAAAQITNKGDTISIKNNTLLEVKGNFDNIDNRSRKPWVHNDGILRVDSNWTGAADMIYSGTDTFIASGPGNQTIAGLSYYNLCIMNGGTKTLQNDASVKSKLIISNGVLNTGSDTMRMDSSAVLLEDSVNNVIGQIKMQKYLAANTNYTFGNMGFDIATSGAVPGFTSIVRVTGPGSAQHGNGTAGISRYFDITPEKDKHLGMNINFHYFSGELNGIAQNDLALYSSEDGGITWKYSGYTNRNSSGCQVTHTAVDSLSRWTLGSKSSALPVSLTVFTAKLVKSDVLLNWVTASEENNNYFDIERSGDAKNWNALSRENGYGTTQEIHYYSATDPQVDFLNEKILYYRLKQVDYNGKFAYSPIRTVKLSADEHASEDVKVWYNSDDDRAYLSINAGNSKDATVMVTDMEGKQIVIQKISVNTGITNVSLNMNGLSKAIYVITYTDDEGMVSKKIVKY